MPHNEQNQVVQMDLLRIFLTPPNTLKEKITLFAMLLVTFVMFFGPICFSSFNPYYAIVLACLPALSISWGYMVLLRALFRKRDFSK